MKNKKKLLVPAALSIVMLQAPGCGDDVQETDAGEQSDATAQQDAGMPTDALVVTDTGAPDSGMSDAGEEPFDAPIV